MPKSLCFTVALVALSYLPLAAQNAGYRVTRNQVLIDRPDHWRAWEGATGSYQIAADGRVQPRFLQRDINAVLNATDFETVVAGGDTIIGGVRQAGSSPETAPLVMDGDMDTYWEPARGDSLGNWFVDLNLGRTVIARQIAVRFAGEGDPFLKFRVLISNGREIDAGVRQGPKFFRVGQVTRRNKSKREFVFEVRPQRPVPPGVLGEVTQLVRFEALDTDGPRGEEVDVEIYQNLALEDRGAIDYFRQTVAGRNIPIDLETYEALPTEEKGPVRYYRHERPRLAELEVQTLGDNIVSLTQRILNRQSNLFTDIVLSLSTDGIFSSFYPLRVYDPLRHRNQVEVDLGAKYWLERIRLLAPDEPLTAYQMRVSDGTLDPGGRRVWTVFDERLNRESFLQLEERFSPQEVRYIELRRLELVGARQETGNLSELQAYGEGYVSQVVLTSPLISLANSRMFTTVEWQGEAPIDTRLEVRTRSGDDLLRVSQYFDRFGREISEQQWESISARNRGEVITQVFPSPRWSNWSELYRASGEAFKSPSPRRMALVQVRLFTSNPLRTATIRSLRLGLAPPLVDQVFAEIWPIADVQLGREEEFTLYIRPSFGISDPGFDRLHILSSSSAPVQLQSLHVGSESALRLGAGRLLWPGELQLNQLEDGSAELLFPQAVLSGRSIYAAVFRTQIFLSGTTFRAEMTRSTRPGVVQIASEGAATDLIDSESLVVVADLGRTALLDGVSAVPPIFTPNGDGINEQTEIRFAVYRLRGERLLRVEIYDLGGRQIRDLSITRSRPSGLHAVPWDGRDQDGHRVPPGIYLARVAFSTDSGVHTTAVVRPVHLVY